MADLNDDLAALKIEREPLRADRGPWVRWIIAIVLLLGGSVAAWHWFTRVRPLEVQVGSVTERAAGTQAGVLNASGYVTARRRATVSSKITGKVIEVNVDEGMAVKEGQVLARLDDAAPKAAMALAAAQVAAARRAVRENEVRLEQQKVTQGRLEELVKQGISTKSDLDAAKADVDATAARIESSTEQINVSQRQLELQQTDLDNTVIRAPFSGVAISKDAQPGEMVSPVSAGGGFTRTGICTIVDMHSLEIEVDVNESYLNRVKAGQGVTAVLDAYPDWQIPAHVITIVPTADRQKATVLVRLGFKKLDPRILPDMGVKVTFLREENGPADASARAAVLAPASAVHTEGGNAQVFVVHDTVVERRAIKVGGTDGDRVEILAGLKPGDRVVISAPNGLKDGDTITIKP